MDLQELLKELTQLNNMANKHLSDLKHRQQLAYDFYAYHEENNICPECGRAPMVFRVPTKVPAKRPCTEFTCVSGHKWIEKDKHDE